MLYIVRKCICSGSGWRLSGWQEMSLWLSASSAIPRGRRLGQSESSLHLMEYGYFTPKLLATITWCEGRTGFVYLCAVRGVWGVFWWVVDVCVCVFTSSPMCNGVMICKYLHVCTGPGCERGSRGRWRGWRVLGINSDQIQMVVFM